MYRCNQSLRSPMQIHYIKCVIQTIIIVMIAYNVDNAEFKYKHLEKHYRSLDKERNKGNSFQYIKISTEVSTDWSAFPPQRPNMNLNKFLDKKYSCPVQMEVVFLNFNVPNGTVCLFKDDMETSLYIPGSKVFLEQNEATPIEFYKDVQTVTGYVMHEMDSLVSGYIIDKKFYGTIRLFDRRHKYHIVYYLEPSQNLILYTTNSKEEEIHVTTSSTKSNAILFEYTSHQNEVPADGKSPKPASSIENENSDNVKVAATEENGKVAATEENGKVAATEENVKVAATEENVKVAATEESVKVVATEDTTDPSVLKESTTAATHENANANDVTEASAKRKKRAVKLSVSNEKQTTIIINSIAEYFGRKIVRKRSVAQEQIDTVQFNVENTLPQSLDIIETLPYIKRDKNTDIFDFRNLSSYTCELCIWVQPNFAQKFGYGGGLKVGTAEVLKIISHLNWIFRTIDFNGDEIPEKIGFVVKEVRVTDTIHLGTTENKGDKGFVEDVETISSETVFSHSSVKLRNIFKGPCCAVLGFIYQNMAPSISTTALRGLCGEKNVAIISGFLHPNKIALYDVYRGMFHAIGHLFGAPHDNPYDRNCWDTSNTRFMNPFALHPIPQLNVGFRPNSMRYTLCSKLEISRFLTSLGSDCLIEEKKPYCGDGMKDDKEECDCGNPSQCYNMADDGLCCGLRNTLMGCKKLSLSEGCPTSFQWGREFAVRK